ncbi:MAG: dicarboxylate/amino acid:cation symporter [Gammaproteobacteria bacterium]|nr:dicarboxylate/amino acid:cation symporter [Gammaproteobacteria bacterium]MDE0285928.1 dicarboxylate/amino acid:cation symporter [Gammaproteobacteria bacterium]
MNEIKSFPQQSGQLESLSRQRLWLQVLIAIALGVGFGMLFGPTTGLVSADTSVLIGNWVALPGKLFLLAIQFVVVPLIVASVIRGIADEGASGSLGVLGARTVSFFVLTTLAAVAIGLFVAGVIKPGNYIDNLLVNSALSGTGAGAAPAAQPMSTPGADEIPDLIVSLFPRDPLTTFVGGNMLQIVVAAAIIGIALVMTSAEQRRPVIDLLASIQAACMVIVGWALRFTPIAVFGLLAQISSRVGLSVLLGTGMYVLSVLVGLLFLFLFYLAIVKLVTRQSVIGFLSAGREVILLAFSTSSSAAVMPVTLTVAEQKLNVRPQVARFVVPLGTTINMGGTALYQGVATLFLAQVFGIEIGMTGLLLVVVMATGAAIGSPGTPGVGIVILATILNSVGVPAEGIALILGVDRLLDMCRTAVNVTGDLVGCVTIDRSLAEPDPLPDKK